MYRSMTTLVQHQAPELALPGRSPHAWPRLLGNRHSLKAMVVLRDFEKQLAKCRGVSVVESAQPLVLICRQDYHGGLSPAGN